MPRDPRPPDGPAPADPPTAEAAPTPERLPGVGERLVVPDVGGIPVTVVRRRGGEVTIRRTGSPDIDLDDAMASAVGAFMGGRYAVEPAVVQRLGRVMTELAFDWLVLRPGDHAVGRTIAELGVRRRTGVTVVAVLRGSLPIVAPDPDLRFDAGDELVFVGRRGDGEGFESYLRRGR